MAAWLISRPAQLFSPAQSLQIHRRSMQRRRFRGRAWQWHRANLKAPQSSLSMTPPACDPRVWCHGGRLERADASQFAPQSAHRSTAEAGSTRGGGFRAQSNTAPAGVSARRAVHRCSCPASVVKVMSRVPSDPGTAVHCSARVPVQVAKPLARLFAACKARHHGNHSLTRHSTGAPHHKLHDFRLVATPCLRPADNRTPTDRQVCPATDARLYEVVGQ